MPDKSQSVSINVPASSKTPTAANLHLGLNQTLTAKTSGSWITHPPNDKGHGAGGILGVAGGSYQFSGKNAKEGCLVVIINDAANNQRNWFPFTSDGQTLSVNGNIYQGDVLFCCNDEPNPDTSAGHKGYADNSGLLTIQATITP